MTSYPGAHQASGRVSDSYRQHARQQRQQALGVRLRMDPKRKRASDEQVDRSECHRSFVLLVRVHAKTFLEDHAQWRHVGDAQNLSERNKTLLNNSSSRKSKQLYKYLGMSYELCSLKHYHKKISHDCFNL